MADPTDSRSVIPASKETQGRSNNIDENTPVDGVKGPNVFLRVKEEVEAIVQAVHPKKEPKVKKERDEKTKEAKASPHHPHHEETHGRNDDIDETTPVGEVKGPNVFSRMKEEVEAIIEAIHPKKDKDDGK